MGGVRRGAAAIYKVLIALFAAAVVVQIFLAGLGIFDAIPDEGESVSSDTWEDKIEAHAAVGWFLFLGSLLLLIIILIAWTGPRSIGATFGLALLTFIQQILGAAGQDAPGVGAFHPINGVLILALALFLTWRAWRGNLLTPPSELRAPAPAAPAP
jgi:hypothetical protein